jgi:hypothetical protein
MGMLHALQHLEFIVYHLLIALDILLEDNLHCDLHSKYQNVILVLEGLSVFNPPFL